MRASLAALLVMVAIVAGTAGVVATAGGSTTADLGPTPNATVDTSVGLAGGDLGLLAAGGDATLRAAFDQSEFESELEWADEGDRPAMLTDRVGALRTEVTDLLAAERAAVADDGDDSEALRREVLLTAADAEARMATLDRLAAFDGTTAGLDLTTAVENLEHRYGVLAGPARQAALTGTGGDGARAVAIEHTDESVAFAAIDGSRYVRDVIRYDVLGSVDRPITNIAQAESRVAQAYPAFTDTVAVREVDGLFVVQRTGEAGSVTAYLDRDAGAIFHEQQTRWLDTYAFEEPMTATEAGIDVAVEVSDDTGPMRVSVTEADTDTPITAPVFVGDGDTWSPVGTTGPDGTLTTVAPATPFDVRVATSDGPVTLSVST